MTLKFIASAALVFLLAAAAPPSAIRPEIVTGDVDLFYAVYEAAGGNPTAEQLQHNYLDKGSDGLDEFARLRRITGERITAAIAKRPEIYVEARQCAAILPTVKARLTAALTRLGELYPPATFPPVTLAIGRTKPVGVGSATGGVMIGLEALCHFDFLNPDPEDRFVSIIAHEYVHVQQPAAQTEEPEATVLEASLIEGGAEFVAELIGGSVGYSHLAAATEGREKELETEFVADQDEKAMGSDWLYNGLGTPERPGDLGYWIGYRIAKAHYLNAQDKKAALRDIIEMRDPRALLAKSGWYPGIKLD
jgi:hypothetical protein